VREMMWIIAWTEPILRDPNDITSIDDEMFMIHTYSHGYATKLIKYLEKYGIPHKWVRTIGWDTCCTGDIIAHLKQHGLSDVIKEVFGNGG